MANQEAIQKLADLVYLSQNTGVATSKMQEAYADVGLDPSDTFAFAEANKILVSNGYKPGEQKDFYGKNQAVDQGAALLSQRWQQAPTAEELAEVGLENVTVINSNSANSEWLTKALADNNISASQTNAITGGTADYSDLDDRLKGNGYWGSKIQEFGSYDNATLDMTEWEELKKAVSNAGSSAVPGGVVSSGPGADKYQPFTGETPDPISQTVDDAITQQTVKPTYTGGSTTGTQTVYRPELGTISSPLQTANLSAVPETFTYRPNYTGTTMRNLTMPSQGQQGVQNVVYSNQMGQTVLVTEVSGQPITYVPPGYVRQGSVTEAVGVAPAVQGSSDTQDSSPFSGIGGGGRGTGDTPYTGPMSGGPMSGNPDASRPSLSDLSKDQELVIGVDGWYVRAYSGSSTSNNAQSTLGRGSALGSSMFAEGGMMRKGYAEGGMPEDPMLEAKFRIAAMNGYNGPKTNAALNSFANSSEGMKRKFNAIGAVMANKGGYIRRGFDGGGVMTTPEQFKAAQQSLVSQTMQPIQSPVAYITPQAADFVAPTAGQTVPQAPYAEAAKVGTVEQAMLPAFTPAASVEAAAVTPAVQTETEKMQVAQGTVAPEAQITAAQQQDSSVTGMQAAQGQAVMVNAPAAREIQQGELISGVADAEKAAQFNEQIQAAEATPTKQATVQGQLETLMQQFEDGETPAWAAGSMRTAMANLSARGLGASSMAGQAVIQAAMEAALPIAQLDAQTQAQFESQNLSNRQQRAMLAAQQRAQFLGQEFDQQFQARVANSARIGDIANMNFTAEQNIALENSRAANTMELNNLSNRQAMVMAEAASLANLDMANLNNRQQAAVQNAQSFLQMDMQNLNNEQQTAMFKAQQNVQALFTDQAADNAAKQFNAASENQTTQFFANLSSQTSQFNAAQTNAMNQFNVNSVNALREFNAEIQQQRDMFNAQNGLVVAQANAQWRQNIATINTAQQNESNANFAKTINGLTANNLDQIWQRERDIMSFAFSSAESAKDRALSILLGDMEVAALEKELSAAESRGKTKFLLDVFEKPIQGIASNLLGGIFG